MIDGISTKRIAALQQTLRTQGSRGTLVVRPGQLGALRNVSPLVGEKSSDFTRNLHRNLTEFIGQRFGITVTDVLCDHEGRLPLIAAQPTFIEHIRNSNGNLEVLGHTVVFEMESDESGKVYFLRNKDNIRRITSLPAPALPPDEEPRASGSFAPVFTLDKSIGGHKREIKSLSFSGDGRKFASASNGLVIVADWPPDIGKRSSWNFIEIYGANCAALNNDCAKLAVAKQDELTIFNFFPLGLAQATIWNSRNGGHEGTVKQVAWSPDGTTLASIGEDCKLLLYKWAEKPFPIDNPIIAEDGNLGALDWHPSDGSLIFARGDILYQFKQRIKTVARLADSPMLSWAQITCLKHSPDGNKILIGDSQGLALVLIDASSGKELREYPLRKENDPDEAILFYPTTSIAWMPQTTVFAAASPLGLYLGDATAANSELRLLSGLLGFNSVSQVAFSPDGEYFVVAGMVKDKEPVIKIYKTIDILGPLSIYLPSLKKT